MNAHGEAAELHSGQLSLNDEIIASIHYVFLDPHFPSATGGFTVGEGEPALVLAQVYGQQRCPVGRWSIGGGAGVMST